MGTLKPDTKYIYESPDGGKTVYAREFGTNEKRIVGYTYDKLESDKKTDQLALWKNILETAENNEALKKALDNAILIYKLVKEEKEEFHVRV